MVLKILGFLVFFLSVLVEDALAWGPAMHTAIACRILQEGTSILPAIAAIIQSFPMEFVYGSLAADFFVGKGTKPRKDHSHNWQTGFRLLRKAKTDRESAYAYGFFSHLAADVIAHNYFVPNLVHQVSTWRKMGHLYWEAKADHSVGSAYITLAKDILSKDELCCDGLLQAAVGKRRNGLKTRRHIYTQTVKLSDLLSNPMSMTLINLGTRYRIAPSYLLFMTNLSYELVKDVLSQPYSSPCLSFDPIGSRNLQLAGRFAVLSRLLDFHRPHQEFKVAQELLGVVKAP
ncbi:MAG: zinc dependent phospholipase C family protein [Desulfatiglandales bacterium]